MKKSVLGSTFLIALVTVFVACNNKSNNSDRVATPPPAPSNQCVVPQNTGNAIGYNNGTCSNQYYDNYTQYGFRSYPYMNYPGYFSNYSYVPLCDCPANYRPVYNGTIGMGCVAMTFFSPIAIGAYYWSLTPNNYQWVNWTQVSNTSMTTVGNQTNCYQQVAQSCFTDQPNTCGAGFACRTTAGGSRLGICAQQ